MLDIFAPLRGLMNNLENDLYDEMFEKDDEGNFNSDDSVGLMAIVPQSNDNYQK